MSATVDIPWGERTLPLTLPGRWNLLGTLMPAEAPALPAPAASLVEHLTRPLGVAALRERDLSGARVVVVVEDGSRPTPIHLFFSAVLDELRAAGVPPENLSVLTGLGVHRPMTRDELEAKVGAENARGLTWFNHDARDPETNTFLGTTSRGTSVSLNRRLLDADLIVLVGGIEPHLLVGFSGGMKMLLPGCASADTIAQNHLQGVTPDRFDLVGVRPEASPMRLDMEEAVGMLGREIFIVNAVTNRHHEICAFFCGHPIEAQRAGVAFSERIHGVEIPEPADILLTCSAPMNHDFRQSMKCVGNNLFAAKPGGQLLGFLRCEQGVGDVDLPPKSLPHPVLRTLLRVIGSGRVMRFVEIMKRRSGVEEKFLAHFSLQVCRRNPLHIYSENLPDDIGKRTGVFRQHTQISDMMNAAASAAPREATVWFAPYGGLTYPILRDGRTPGPVA